MPEPDEQEQPNAPNPNAPDPLERDEIELRIDGLIDDDLNRGMTFFRSRMGATEAAYLHACVRCGQCAESCHYFRATREPEDIPGRKLGVITSAAKARTLAGAMFAGMVGVRDFDRAAVREWMDAAYGRCTLCGRCSLNCVMGIHISSILQIARGTLGIMGLTPPELKASVQNSMETGNHIAISKEDFLDTIKQLEQGLQTETGDQTACIPVDKPGARVLFTFNPRALKPHFLELLSAARIFHEAKEDWTISSEGWDSTNYGLFTGSAKEGGSIASPMMQAAQRLGVKFIAMGESGHGYLATRWEAAEWLQKKYGFEVISVLELLASYLRDGRIHVDRTKIQGRVTLHDPCDLVRLGGVFEPQREILRHLGVDFVEMSPNREQNFCCGGGGGQLSMARYHDRRIKAGSVKAEQIRATTATIVAAPCCTCQDQLTELNKEYKLGVTVKGLTELVAEALRMTT